jgi:hypothetical protein
VRLKPDEMTGTEQAVLLVLMAEARPVRNPELSTLGPELKADKRKRLEDKGLIEITKDGRTMVLELTEIGWATCAELIGAETPKNPSGQGKALYTVLRALRRYFDREDIAPGDVFLPLDEHTPEGDPDPLADDIEAKVRSAYVRLAAYDGGWVDLVRLRAALPDVSKRDLDDALTKMYRVPGVSLMREDNQKTLTADDHAAAVQIGNQPKHMIAIQR